jgi:hypothetical protein
MGLSLGGLVGSTQLELAWQRMEAHARSMRGNPSWAMLAQEQRKASHLAVCLHSDNCPYYVEIHPEPGTASLEDGRSPSYAGPISGWGHPAAAELKEQVDRMLAVPTLTSLGGVDLELVLDPEGWWAVQARPLVRELQAGWPRFESMLSAPELAQLHGNWVLDAEHNPAPLSTAHRWVLERLRAQRPGSFGEPTTFNGWLYLRTPMRKVASSSRPSHDPRRSLERLQGEWLPSLRSQALAFERQLAEGELEATGVLPAAEALFLSMADTYLHHLMPARRAAVAAAASLPTRDTRTQQPATLSGKSRHLSALPVEWDIASPTLAENAGLEPRSQEPFSGALPEPSAADLDARDLPLFLGEWDDHYFAWGLRPLRKAYQHLAQQAGITDEAVFELRGDELVALCLGKLPLHEAAGRASSRAERRRREGELSPPARIIARKPYPNPAESHRTRGGGLRGFGVGEPFAGSVAMRSSLADLIDNPPLPEQVACLPTLTAPAAWVLHRLDIKAVCTRHGGAASHGSLMARELGLSAIIGCAGLASLRDGERIELLPGRGEIRRLNDDRVK